MLGFKIPSLTGRMAWSRYSTFAQVLRYCIQSHGTIKSPISCASVDLPKPSWGRLPDLGLFVLRASAVLSLNIHLPLRYPLTQLVPSSWSRSYWLGILLTGVFRVSPPLWRVQASALNHLPKVFHKNASGPILGYPAGSVPSSTHSGMLQPMSWLKAWCGKVSATWRDWIVNFWGHTT